MRKDKARQGKGEKPRDADVRWGAKGNKIVAGKEGPEKKVAYFYGYKDQVSLNAEAGIVTSIVVGQGDDYDGQQMRKLVEQDMALGVKPVILAADRGYDDGENHYYLKEGRESAPQP